jgi:phosphatidylethanolamine/phosphatidyl-N-methylethanolamine N-methyltransferase
MPSQILARLEKKKNLRLDDEVHFIRSWLEKPLATGAVTPSGRVLAKAMARYVDPDIPGPVIELGPGTGPVTEALLEQGVAEERLVLVEFNPTFCQLLHARFPKASVMQGDAYGMLRRLGHGMRGGAPFVQFTYAVVPPIPKMLADGQVEASDRIWLNLPPARVWVYRKG